MIITVTMNPAIDKTVDIDRFVHGGLNRIRRVCLDAGGKGINVSKTIHHLGGETIATGFVAGSAGETIEGVLREYGIRTAFVRVAGETRTNMKVVEADGPVTELNEPGPEVTKANIQELLAKLESYAAPDTLVVLSGSIPRGVPGDIYGAITEKMHAKGACVLLDADGELFSRSLYAKPDIIKPNRMELEQYFAGNGMNGEGDGLKNERSLQTGEPGQKESGSSQAETHSRENAESDVLQMGRKLLDMGIGLVAISMGSEGAAFLQKDCCLRCPGLSVKAHSTVGAGDAMVAALAMAWQQKLPLPEAAALGMAASAGAVTTTGTKPPSKEVVEELLGQVKIENALF